MRRFFLQNSIGDRKSLQVHGELFFSSPTGLGFSNSNTYSNADGFFTRTYRELVQGSIAGELVFGGYDQYKSFVDWIFSGYELSLVYCPKNTEYVCDIDIQSIEKTELRKGVLICPISIIQNSPWYRMTAVNSTIAPPYSDIGWTNFPFTLPSRLAPSGMVSSVDLHPAGHMPAAVTIEIKGQLVDPIISLKDGDVTLGLLDLTGTSIAAGKTLKFSSKPGNVGVWCDDENLISAIDIANNNFFRVPQNKTSRLHLTTSSTMTTGAIVKLYEYYRTV